MKDKIAAKSSGNKFALRLKTSGRLILFAQLGKSAKTGVFLPSVCRIQIDKLEKMMKNEISNIKPTREIAAETESARAADYELAQKAAAGDLEAFEQIYWIHHRRVFGICVRMTKDAAEAEDVTQQVFLNLFKRIGSFRGDSAFSTWLHRITVNQMLMHIRSNKARKEDVTEDGQLPETDFSRQQKPNSTNQIADRLQLNQAIAQLADGYRKVLILHDIEGFEHDEIARMLGCASGTSKSQLHKARRVLRRLLQAGDSADGRMPKTV